MKITIEAEPKEIAELLQAILVSPEKNVKLDGEALSRCIGIDTSKISGEWLTGGGVNL